MHKNTIETLSLFIFCVSFYLPSWANGGALTGFLQKSDSLTCSANKNVVGPDRNYTGYMNGIKPQRFGQVVSVRGQMAFTDRANGKRDDVEFEIQANGGVNMRLYSWGGNVHPLGTVQSSYSNGNYIIQGRHYGGNNIVSDITISCR